MFENVGMPEDKFDEQELEKEAEADVETSESQEEQEESESSSPRSKFDDQTMAEIIEIFAEERDGFYYGRPERIGTKEECIRWVRDILKSELGTGEAETPVGIE